MNGFAAFDNSPCLRYVVVKATAGFAVCRLVLNLLLFYSCLDFTQNWGETRNKSFISIGGIKYGRVNAGNPFFYLVIKNFGKSTAYITKFEYDFDFNGCYKIRNDRDYLQQLNNAVLAPGQSRICTLDYQRIDRAVTFTLEYHSGAKKTYSDEFTIDLKAGVSMPYGKVATEGKELRTISYALQEMLQKNL